MTDRFDRNVMFFGREGQERLTAASIVVVGVGGLGTHVRSTTRAAWCRQDHLGG